MEKTVMEWLGEIKLYNKKIAKKERELSATELFYADTAIRFDKDKAEEYLKETLALYQGYKQLIKNRDLIRQAVLKFNASTFIEVGENKYTIAEALEKLKNPDTFLIELLENNIDNLIQKEAELKKLQEEEVKELEKILYGSNKAVGNTTISEKLQERREAYSPIIEEAFNLKKELDIERDKHEEFNEKISTLINIVNVKNTLTIELN